MFVHKAVGVYGRSIQLIHNSKKYAFCSAMLCHVGTQHIYYISSVASIKLRNCSAFMFIFMFWYISYHMLFMREISILCCNIKHFNITANYYYNWPDLYQIYILKKGNHDFAQKICIYMLQYIPSFESVIQNISYATAMYAQAGYICVWYILAVCHFIAVMYSYGYMFSPVAITLLRTILCAKNKAWREQNHSTGKVYWCWMKYRVVY